jgi:hypothetical protein
MRVIASTNFRAIENYESKKEKWLLQVAADSELSAGALRVAVGIGLHMNRKQRLLAWPGFGRLQKLLGIHRDTVRRNVKALEARGHVRVVRSRNGRKNNPNHYHPNIWRTEVGAATHLGRCTDAPWVGAALHPEPMSEPMNEPMKEVREGTKVLTMDTVDTKKEEGLSETGTETIPFSSPTPSDGSDERIILEAQRKRLNDLSDRLARFKPKLNGGSAPLTQEVG